MANPFEQETNTAGLERVRSLSDDAFAIRDLLDSLVRLLDRFDYLDNPIDRAEISQLLRELDEASQRAAENLAAEVGNVLGKALALTANVTQIYSGRQLSAKTKTMHPRLSEGC